MSDRHITIGDVEQARARLTGRIHRTPMVDSPSLSERTGVPVHLKLEAHQKTGSFKLRGATNAVLSLSDAERERGIVGVSTGNHGRGLAYAAREAGVRCIICMSELVPQNKLDGIKAQGAEIRIVGRSQDDAEVEALRLVSDDGMIMLPPFDNPYVIAGQGTLGLEIIEDMPDVASVLVPLSGGGLIAGIALAVKTHKPDTRIIGISMERGAAMVESLNAGEVVQVDELPTLADSLGGGLGQDNRYTFEMVRDLVDETVLLTEPEIAEGVRHAYWKEQEIVEGGGGVGIAAILAEKVQLDGPSVLVLSGRNLDMQLHYRIISGENPDPAGE